MREYKVGDRVRLCEGFGKQDYIIEGVLLEANQGILERWDFEMEDAREGYGNWCIQAHKIECLVDEDPEYEWVCFGDVADIVMETNHHVIYTVGHTEFCASWYEFESAYKKVLKKTPQSVEQMKLAGMLGQ